jgi:hypothetical protein
LTCVDGNVAQLFVSIVASRIMLIVGVVQAFGQERIYRNDNDINWATDCVDWFVRVIDFQPPMAHYRTCFSSPSIFS